MQDGASVDATHPVDRDLLDEFELRWGLVDDFGVIGDVGGDVILGRTHVGIVQRRASALARWVSGRYCGAITTR